MNSFHHTASAAIIESANRVHVNQVHPVSAYVESEPKDEISGLVGCEMIAGSMRILIRALPV
jgi:hypothetical protein